MSKPSPRFDISWIGPPDSRGGDDQDWHPQDWHPDSPAPVVIPPPLDPGMHRADPGKPRTQSVEDRTSKSDERLLSELRSEPAKRLHVVDLAARLGVEFDDALRSVLRLVARRQLVIEQRDPLADDHLVSLAGTTAADGV
jgi:hypothetical protein